jgi:hypothetical protein
VSISRPPTDPVVCPLCQGAIPGSEILQAKNCPSCGADLAKEVKRRLAQSPAKAEAPLQPADSFASLAGLASIILPLCTIVINHVCYRIEHSSRTMLISGIASGIFIFTGLTLAIVAAFSGEEDAVRSKGMIGLWLNGFFVLFLALHFVAYQKMAAREQNTAAPPPKKSSIYISGK